jgi:hypothetical protein
MPGELLRSSKEILEPKFLAELSLIVAGNEAKMAFGDIEERSFVQRFVFYCSPNDYKKETCLSRNEIL